MAAEKANDENYSILKPCLHIKTTVYQMNTLIQLKFNDLKKNQFQLKFQSRIIIQSLLFALFLFTHTGFAQIKKVWALGDGEKIFRDDREHPNKNGNLIWDGKAIRLNGLYNEVLAFQVIVETDKVPVENIEVSVDMPVNKESAKIIGGNTLKYGSSGTIEIFAEHYLNVKDSTPPNWFYGSPAAHPKKMTGWIPDALIPSDALRGLGGFPVSIGPSQNQGFWIDVHCPRDQVKPSG